jgi:hypothetical protein
VAALIWDQWNDGDLVTDDTIKLCQIRRTFRAECWLSDTATAVHRINVPYGNSLYAIELAIASRVYIYNYIEIDESHGEHKVTSQTPHQNSDATEPIPSDQIVDTSTFKKWPMLCCQACRCLTRNPLGWLVWPSTSISLYNILFHLLLFFLRCFLLRRLAGAHQALGPPSLLLLELSLILCLILVLLFIRMPCSGTLDSLFPALDLLETLDLGEDGLKVHGFFRVDFFEGVGVGEVPAEETDGGTGK